MNKMTLQGYTAQLCRTSSTAFTLVFLLFLTACHHKAASKQAKIDREKEKNFQIEQKEIADLKKEKKNNPPKSVDVPKDKKAQNGTISNKTGAKNADIPNKSVGEKQENRLKPVESQTRTTGVAPKGPLSKKEEKPPLAVAPKSDKPLTTVTPKHVNVSPTNALSASTTEKMGSCIEFFPNKSAISGNSMACLKEISMYLKNNKTLRLAISANMLPTEKAADAFVLKTERAKTVRNYLIQSGIEAQRLHIKLSDSNADAPIVMTPDESNTRKK